MPSDRMLDSGAGRNRERMTQRYTDAGWDEESAGQYARNANQQLFQQQMQPGGRGIAGMGQAIEDFEVPQIPTEMPEPTDQPSTQQMSPEAMAALMAYLSQRRGQQQQAQPQPQQYPQEQQYQQAAPKMASMQKTASQIARIVLEKCAAKKKDKRPGLFEDYGSTRGDIAIPVGALLGGRLGGVGGAIGAGAGGLLSQSRTGWAGLGGGALGYAGGTGVGLGAGHLAKALSKGKIDPAVVTKILGQLGGVGGAVTGHRLQARSNSSKT